eukprot:Selendium_serpulae@DN6384_c6_g1_i10.p1
MNHYKLISLLLGVVAVADADYGTSKHFIHSVEFKTCKTSDTESGGFPLVGVALNGEAGDFTVELWNDLGVGDAFTEEVTLTALLGVPGQVEALQAIFTNAVADAGGGLVLKNSVPEVVDCIWFGTAKPAGASFPVDCVDSTAATPFTTAQIYSLATDPASIGTYKGEEKADFVATVTDDTAMAAVTCMVDDMSAAASFGGSNIATAFVNEVVRNLGPAKFAFEVAALGAVEYTLYYGDASKNEKVDVPAGTPDVWNFHQVDNIIVDTDWDMASGFAVLTDKTTGEILSSITWGTAPVAVVTLGTVNVYPLVVVVADLEDQHALALTGTDMENKSTGVNIVWADLTTSTLGAENDGQNFVAAATPPPQETTVAGEDGTLPIGGTTEAAGGDAETTTVAAATGSGYTSKIGALTVMGSMALVLSS